MGRLPLKFGMLLFNNNCALTGFRPDNAQSPEVDR